MKKKNKNGPKKQGGKTLIKPIRFSVSEWDDVQFNADMWTGGNASRFVRQAVRAYDPKKNED